MSISIIIPTMGRATLLRALLSLSCQLHTDDQIILVSDGPSENVKRIADRSGVNHVIYESSYQYRNCGHRCGNAARDFGMRKATRDILAFLDDDDVYMPNALFSIRKITSIHNNVPIIFKMIHTSGKVLWNAKSVTYGNIGTPMFVIPNNQDKLGTWGLKSGGDFDFISQTISNYSPDSVIWSNDIICCCRPF